jgi:hypothetical protein
MEKGIVPRMQPSFELVECAPVVVDVLEHACCS